MRTKNLASALAVVLTLFTVAPSSAHADDSKGLEIGEDAPNLVHFDTRGKRFSLSDFVKIEGEFPPFKDKAGAAVVVFGAHWCTPCKEVVKSLAAEREALDAAKVHILYVHIDDKDRSDGLSQKEIRKLAKKMAAKPDYEGVRVLLGGDMAEVRTWMGDPEYASLPGIVLISADGKINARPKVSEVSAAVKALMETPPAEAE